MQSGGSEYVGDLWRITVGGTLAKVAEQELLHAAFSCQRIEPHSPQPLQPAPPSRRSTTTCEYHRGAHASASMYSADSRGQQPSMWHNGGVMPARARESSARTRYGDGRVSPGHRLLPGQQRRRNAGAILPSKLSSWPRPQAHRRSQRQPAGVFTLCQNLWGQRYVAIPALDASCW